MSIPLIAGALLTCSSGWLLADVRSDSYQIIVERNAFGLKPPPPAVPVTNVEPQQPINIKFTGITADSKMKVAYFMIPDAKAPGGAEFVALSEGEREGVLEVLEGGIDEKQGKVRVRNAGVVSVLDFEKHGNKAAGPGPMLAGTANRPGIPAVPSGPAIPNAAPGSNPQMLQVPGMGGRPAIPPPPTAMANPVSIAPTVSPNAPITLQPVGAQNPSSSRVPTRMMRNNTYVAPGHGQTAEQSIINMELQRMINKGNIDAGAMPPLPPTPLSE